MKKDRNCDMPGAMYGMNMPGMNMGYMAPGMIVPTPGVPMQPNMNFDNMNNNSNNSTMDQLQAQINNLDRRVTRLENQMQDKQTTYNTNNTYMDTNYQMM